MNTSGDTRQPKRVLFVELNVDGTIGGSYFSLFYLVTGLDRVRYDPTVVFAAPNELIPMFKCAGVDASALRPRVPARTTSVLLRPFFRLINFVASKAFSLRSVVRFAYILKRKRADLLHLNNSVDAGAEWLIAALICRVPCITHQRGIMARRSFFARWCAHRFAGVICISSAVRNSLERIGLGGLPRITTIHNGLDPQAQVPRRSESEVREALGISASQRIIGMVGNIQRWKGQDVVVRAIADVRWRFPDMICLLIGAVSPSNPEDVEYYSELRQLIFDSELTDRVILTGYQANVADFVSVLEIVIHASVTPEPFGRVLLEGMAQRKAVIACRAGGVEEIIVDGATGLLYSPGNHAELAACIASLYEDKRRRDEMGEAGYKRLNEHFSISRNVEATVALYDSILQQRA